MKKNKVTVTKPFSKYEKNQYDRALLFIGFEGIVIIIGLAKKFVRIFP